jgi:ABC-type transport system involved in multi-copper enzyme maturation permease subunit
MNTPFFMILTGGGAFLLFLFVWLPYNTFGEDIKMLKFTTLDAMLVIAMLQAVWSASSSIAEEVEGRTALTVLSKPVGRRDFIVGKFLGIAWLVMVMFVVFGSVTLLSVAYKPIFDAKEGGKSPDRPNVVDPLGIVDPARESGITADEVNWQICFAEMASSIPAILLVYCETLVMVAVSVAISTRLALVANVMICFSIYALGHLTPLLVQSAEVAERFEPVIFMGQLIAAVLPVLEYYDVKAAIAKGAPIQLAYVGATFVYTALYSTIAMLLALVLFEDRDLA